MQSATLSNPQASSALPLPSPVNFSPAATSKVAELLQEENNPAMKLRIYVTGGGCSGFSYGFALDDQTNDDDTLIEQDGVRILVDMMSLQYLMGAEVDYEDNLSGARFIIQNPNAQTTCGCGSSFSV